MRTYIYIYIKLRDYNSIVTIVRDSCVFSCAAVATNVVDLESDAGVAVPVDRMVRPWIMQDYRCPSFVHIPYIDAMGISLKNVAN